MIIQGKHSNIRLYKEIIRVFKTYKDSSYVNNEFFALDFLAKQEIMNLNPQIESPFTISMDWIREAESPQMNSPENRAYMVTNLASYLKILHDNSFKSFNHYITHEDLFLDNFLVSNNSNMLFFIDWGLSKKRDNVYPDIASALLGAFNDYPNDYRLFLDEYFGRSYKVDFKLIEKYSFELFNEYRLIREENEIETNSLKQRLEKVYQSIQLLSS
jgi:serine/threonine protein kinase